MIFCLDNEWESLITFNEILVFFFLFNLNDSYLLVLDECVFMYEGENRLECIVNIDH